MASNSNQGYSEEAAKLIHQYENIRFEDIHQDVMHLFPKLPSRVIDIGAGTGRDAAALAKLGHKVVAVEPTFKLRETGKRLHAAYPIEWIDDSLPDLSVLQRSKRCFDLILLTAVWMHLDAADRKCGMKMLSTIMSQGGQTILTLRHGPIPRGRQMFDVTGAETVSLAEEYGLETNHIGHRADSLGRTDITWTVVGLRPGQ
jgi:2-polyprenyl-3-methyl-5-hydroxy-6-metoxy-1,4-benzoquinol methylase